MVKNLKLFFISIPGLVLIVSFSTLANNKYSGQSYDQNLIIEHVKEKGDRNTMEIVKPNRVTHTCEQTINGNIKEIMPLYCPVKEVDWIEDWPIKTVYSYSGVVEKECIFITNHGDGTDLLWIVTAYDIETGYVEMYYLIPNILVNKLQIKVTPITDKKTKAVITYTKTSLSNAGNKILEEFTKENYETMMDSWEKAMNYYLESGKILTDLPNF